MCNYSANMLSAVTGWTSRGGRNKDWTKTQSTFWELSIPDTVIGRETDNHHQDMVLFPMQGPWKQRSLYNVWIICLISICQEWAGKTGNHYQMTLKKLDLEYIANDLWTNKIHKLISHFLFCYLFFKKWVDNEGIISINEVCWWINKFSIW